MIGKDKNKHKADKDLRINQQIRSQEVRLIDESGNQIGVVSLEEALNAAKSSNKDLVEIVPKSNPCVCKILDYGKYKFDQKRKLKISQKNIKKTQIKEIKLRPKIDEHDYQFKLKHITSFISKGDKVKLSLQFKGREMAYVDLGYTILNRLKKDIGENIIIEKEANLEGRQMNMIISPNTK